jgi:hypothetical protein
VKRLGSSSNSDRFCFGGGASTLTRTEISRVLEVLLVGYWDTVPGQVGYWDTVVVEQPVSEVGSVQRSWGGCWLVCRVFWTGME